MQLAAEAQRLHAEPASVLLALSTDAEGEREQEARLHAPQPRVQLVVGTARRLLALLGRPRAKPLLRPARGEAAGAEAARGARARAEVTAARELLGDRRRRRPPPARPPRRRRGQEGGGRRRERRAEPPAAGRAAQARRRRRLGAVDAAPHRVRRLVRARDADDAPRRLRGGDPRGAAPRPPQRRLAPQAGGRAQARGLRRRRRAPRRARRRRGGRRRRRRRGRRAAAATRRARTPTRGASRRARWCRQRAALVDAFARREDVPLLVTTELAARGVDLKGVDVVFMVGLRAPRLVRPRRRAQRARAPNAATPSRSSRRRRRRRGSTRSRRSTRDQGRARAPQVPRGEVAQGPLVANLLCVPSPARAVVPARVAEPGSETRDARQRVNVIDIQTPTTVAHASATPRPSAAATRGARPISAHARPLIGPINTHSGARSKFSRALHAHTARAPRPRLVGDRAAPTPPARARASKRRALPALTNHAKRKRSQPNSATWHPCQPRTSTTSTRRRQRSAPAPSAGRPTRPRRRRRRRAATAHDRFISNRSAMDLDVSNYELMRPPAARTPRRQRVAREGAVQAQLAHNADGRPSSRPTRCSRSRRRPTPAEDHVDARALHPEPGGPGQAAQVLSRDPAGARAHPRRARAPRRLLPQPARLVADQRARRGARRLDLPVERRRRLDPAADADAGRAVARDERSRGSARATTWRSAPPTTRCRSGTSRSSSRCARWTATARASRRSRGTARCSRRAARDSTIVHHDVRAPAAQGRLLKGHAQEVCGLKWSPSGTQLASGGNDNLLNIWDDRYTASSTSSNGCM